MDDIYNNAELEMNKQIQKRLLEIQMSIADYIERRSWEIIPTERLLQLHRGVHKELYRRRLNNGNM